MSNVVTVEYNDEEVSRQTLERVELNIVAGVMGVECAVASSQMHRPVSMPAEAQGRLRLGAREWSVLRARRHRRLRPCIMVNKAVLMPQTNNTVYYCLSF